MMLNKLHIFLVVGCAVCLSNLTYAGVKYIDMSHASTQSVALIANVTKDKTATAQDHIDTIITANARKYDISAALIRAIIQQESNFNTSAISPKGARGLMQVMPETASDYGRYNLHIPSQNIEVGSRHLSNLLKKHDLPVALAAYNAGEGSVNKYGGIPPFVETQNYVLNVLRHYNIELDKQIEQSGAQQLKTALVTEPNRSVLSSDKPAAKKRASVQYITLNN